MSTARSTFRPTTRRLVAALAATAAASAASLAVAVPAHAAPTPFTNALGTVVASSLNVRQHPTTASTRVGVIQRNAVVFPVCSVVGQSVAGTRTWYWAEAGSSGGYVSAKYVKVTQGHVPACSQFPDMTLMHADITSAAQVNTKLAGTSASFRAFVTHKLATMKKTSGCATPTVSVTGWWKGNQAIGGVQDCGGYLALWTYTGGQWHELGTQAALPCSDLRKAGATHRINGNTGFTCTVRSNGRTILVQYDPRG